MKTKNLLLTLVFVICLAFPSIVVNASNVELPKQSYKFYTYDEAGIIDDATEQYIITVNESLARQTGAQVVVATVNDLQGRTLEEYANLLFREWEIGDKTKNNGILLLVAYSERQVRIEVGYGLEGAVPDITAGKIISDNIIPEFKSGNYNQGILNGFNAIMENVAREYNIDEDNLAIDQSRSTSPSKGNALGRFFGGIGKFILILLFIIDLVLNRGRMSRFLLFMFMSGRGRGGGGGFGGGSGGGGNFGGGGSSGGGGASGSW